MEVLGALEDALEAVGAAERVSHGRAEMVARLTAGRIRVEKGDVAAAEPHIIRGLELAESLGANRFKPFLTIYLGRIRFAQHGHRRETTELMREALAISRETGIGFLGPWVLSTLALVEEDPEAGAVALEEGEQILASGCVGHNYFAFYRSAVEVALRNGDWDGVERHARALHDYTRPEPLPWADFFVKCARTLAAHGRGKRDDTTLQELESLKHAAEAASLLSVTPAIEQALAAG